MPNFIQQAMSNVLRRHTKALAGVAIVYKSWSTGLEYKLTATPDSSRAESETQEGMIFSEVFRDYKIDIVDLPVMPQPKDEITEIDQYGVPQHYIILTDAGNREVEPGDSFGTYWVVHCKMRPAVESLQAAYGNAAGVTYGTDDPNGVTHGGASN